MSRQKRPQKGKGEVSRNCSAQARAAKRAALFVFRYMESTVVKDMLNKQCEKLADTSNCLFHRKFLVNPTVLTVMVDILVVFQIDLARIIPSTALHCAE